MQQLLGEWLHGHAFLAYARAETCRGQPQACCALPERLPTTDIFDISGHSGRRRCKFGPTHQGACNDCTKLQWCVSVAHADKSVMFFTFSHVFTIWLPVDSKHPHSYLSTVTHSSEANASCNLGGCCWCCLMSASGLEPHTPGLG